MISRLRLATRQSPLAMAQAEMAAAYLRERQPGLAIEIVAMTTTGDQQANWSLAQKGGKGLFTKELEDALLENRADVAVHSAKDLPSTLPEGLALAGYLPRGPVEDVLVLRDGVETPRTIASGSPRRRAQCKGLFPHAVFKELRGRVETRLDKIARGEADATFLAAAGLARLGITAHEGVTFRTLTPEEMIPAAGQGAIALEVCESETEPLSPLLHAETHFAVTLEKALLAGMGEGCHTSLGVHYAGSALHVFQETLGQRHFPIKSTDLTKALAQVDDCVIVLKDSHPS